MSSNSQMTMPIRLKVRHVWVHGFLFGLILGVLGICAYYFNNSLPFFLPTDENASRPLAISQFEETLPAKPNVSPPQGLTSEANLETELAQVFKGIKETTLRKDIDGLMSLYSSKFPDLPKRTSKINKSWKIYDYQKMDFKVHEIKNITEDSAVAWITWNLAIKELATGKTKDISKTYEVTFKKESKQWRIVGLKNAFW